MPAARAYVSPSPQRAGDGASAYASTNVYPAAAGAAFTPPSTAAAANQGPAPASEQGSIPVAKSVAVAHPTNRSRWDVLVCTGAWLLSLLARGCCRCWRVFASFWAPLTAAIVASYGCLASWFNLQNLFTGPCDPRRPCIGARLKRDSTAAPQHSHLLTVNSPVCNVTYRMDG